jgi:hypothetical protein
MEGNARTWFTPKQRAELWERWEERSMCGGYRPRACEEEQERRLSGLGSAWRNRTNATPERSARAEA